MSENCYTGTESSEETKLPSPEKMEDIIGKLSGIKVVQNDFVPANTILFVKDMQLIKIMCDVLNSRLYRFIIWYQGLFKKLFKRD